MYIRLVNSKYLTVLIGKAMGMVINVHTDYNV